MTGSQFERIIVRALGDNGYWAHRIAPDARGAQPFDVIAVGNGVVIAADCKVCKSGRFSFSRLEENQRMAFELVSQRNKGKNNVRIGIFAWYDGDAYWLDYNYLMRAESLGRKTLLVTEGDKCKPLCGNIY